MCVCVWEREREGGLIHRTQDRKRDIKPASQPTRQKHALCTVTKLNSTAPNRRTSPLFPHMLTIKIHLASNTYTYKPYFHIPYQLTCQHVHFPWVQCTFAYSLDCHSITMLDGFLKSRKTLFNEADVNNATYIPSATSTQYKYIIHKALSIDEYMN